MHMQWLTPYQEHAYLLLRIVSGLMFAFHGVQKIFGLFTDKPTVFLSQLWWGGLIELVCGVAIALGLLTRAAAFLSSGTMAVAYFQYHWKFQWGNMVFPTINRGELAALYCFIFLYIATRGAGRWALDKT